MLTKETKEKLHLAINTLTWLNQAPAAVDIPDRLFDRVHDQASDAIEDARKEMCMGERTDDDYEMDEENQALDLLLTDTIEASEQTAGKADYEDLCTLAETVAAKFKWICVDGVDEATHEVTWGTIA